MTAWFLSWLWQGTALTIGVAAFFRLAPRTNAATRHLILWGTLMAVVWLGCASAARLLVPGSEASASAGLRSPIILEVPALYPWAGTFLFTAWALVTSLKLLRLLLGLRGLRRLRASCTPLSHAIQAGLPLWTEARARGRRTALMVCDGVSGPAVLGMAEPYIAIPPLLFDAVSPDELDQIVLHEYAHVQRRDDWTRLAQAVLESALWIHPGVIWIGRALNLEREVACDDWVICRTQEPRAYAGCLSRAAESQQRAAALFMPGLFGGNREIVLRVNRLLDSDRRLTRKLSRLVATAAVCVVMMAAFHLRMLPLVVEALTPEVYAAASEFTIAAAPLADLMSPSQQRPQQGRALVANAPSARRSTIPIRSNTAERRPASWPLSIAPQMVPNRASVGDLPTLLIASRSVDGIYSGAAVASPSSPDVTGWRLAGRAGTQIGKVGRTAGLGVAKTFSRAGASIAASF